MKTVTLTMIDECTEQEVERTIDITNAMETCSELKGVESQRKNLNNWINERGNSQHETILTLVSWTFN